MSGDNEVQVIFGANIEGLIAGVEAVKGELQGMVTQIEGITSTFTELGGLIAEVFAVEQLEQFAEKVAEIGVNFERTAMQTGLTAKEISTLDMAARDMDVPIATMNQSLSQLSIKLAESQKGTGMQAQALKSLGVEAFDSQGKLKSMSELVSEIADSFHKAQDGPAKTADAIALFGRAGASLIPILDKGSEGLKELNDQAKEVGLSFGQDTIDKFLDINAELIKMRASFEGLGASMALTLKPIIDLLSKGISQLAIDFRTGTEEAGAFQGIVMSFETAFKGLATTVVIVYEGVKALINLIEGGLSGAYITVAAGYSALTDMITGDNTFQIYKDAMVENDKKSNDNIVKNAKDAADAIKQIWDVGDAPKGKDTKGTGALDLIGKEIPNQMQVWENALNKMLLDKQLFGKEATDAELKYWESVVTLTKQGSQDRSDIEKKIYDLEKQERSEAMQEQKQDQAEDIAANKAYLETQLADAGDNLEKKKALYSQYLLWLKLQYPADTVAYNQALKAQTEITNQEIKKQEQTWQSFGQNIFSTFNSSLNSMIRGTETWQQAIGDLFLSVGDGFAKIVEKMIEDWAVKEIFGSAASKATSLGEITDSAAVAGAAAYASTAAIPVIGPELAPAAAIKASTETAAFSAGLASYDVGAWSVSGDQIAKIHDREMIVPRSFAEDIRSNGGLGGSGGDSFTINAVDAASFKSLIMQHGPTIAASVKKQSGKMNKALKGAS